MKRQHERSSRKDALPPHAREKKINVLHNVLLEKEKNAYFFGKRHLRRERKGKKKPKNQAFGERPH